MPGCKEPWRLEARILEPWRLVGLPAGLQDWIGLDVSGCWIGGSGGIGGFPVFSHARRSRRSADMNALIADFRKFHLLGPLL